MAASHAKMKAIPCAVTKNPHASQEYSVLLLTTDHQDQPISVTSLNKSTLVLKTHALLFFITRHFEKAQDLLKDVL